MGCRFTDAVQRDVCGQKKRLNGSGEASGAPIGTEEFYLHLMRRGFPLSEVDNWDTGMLLNFCYEHDRMIQQQNGEVVHDQMKRYQIMKDMEPEMERMYAAGEIREKKYRDYKAALRRCEELLGVTDA